MSRVLVIGSEAHVSREIGRALSATDFPMEYSLGMPTPYSGCACGRSVL